MQSQDLDVLSTALAWQQQGHRVVLHTIIQTFGSAPRPPGSLVAIRGDGQVEGSVSGGCIEDDLIDRVRNSDIPVLPQLLTYGISAEEANRFQLPCGGTIRIIRERIKDPSWLEHILSHTANHQLAQRRLDLTTGITHVIPVEKSSPLTSDEHILVQTFGPKWRLLLIGAGQISKLTAEMARALDFDVLVCDPRKDYSGNWDSSVGRLVPGMPDDVVESLAPDAHMAIVALTHDPKLDDMALLTALKSNAFYVGALGSKATTTKRKNRLLDFDITQDELDRLHGPVGLDLGSRSPAEIAVSILAEIIATKNGHPRVRR